MRLALDAADLPAVAAEEDARRQTPDGKGATEFALGIEIGLERLQAELFPEGIHYLRAAPVLGNRQDFEAVSAQPRLRPFERGHLLHAGDAPGGPKIDEDEFPAEFRQGTLRAGPVLENRLRRRPG